MTTPTPRLFHASCVALLVLAAVSACSSSKTQERTQELAAMESNTFEDEPTWASKPPKGCGVGVVKYRGNRGMARTAASGRARDELARNLSTSVEGALKDYARQGEAVERDFTEEQITQVSRQIVDQTLSGTEITATHVTDSDAPNFYALVCLNPEAFKGVIQGMNALSSYQRAALAERARLEFEDLDQALEARRDR